MGPKWIEQDRLLSLETPLGADKLLLRSFSGQEGISRLFGFHLDLLSEDHNVDFDKIIGQKVTFGVKLYQPGQERYFNGYVSRFRQLPGEERLARYEAEVVPWLWFLTRTADCRIFQNMTVPDIVQDVLKGFGFQDIELQLHGTYDSREYCVQYRETAFNFVSRLMEQEGIFYFFRHEKSKHVLVLGDSPSAHKPCPVQAKVEYERTGGIGAKAHEDVIFQWRTEQELRPGKYALADYNFETPSTRLLANVNSQINQGGNQRFEVFDYPGEFGKRNAGDQYAKVRMEEEETGHATASGEGNCRTFTAGFKFELYGFERRDQNGSYVLVEVSHTAEEGGFYSGAGSGEASYRNSFLALPSAVPYRPPHMTRQPVVWGAQTAVVVGPSGEEIYSDKYGRVKVQFHWDRVGKRDEKSSCWIRVSQPWAGKNWGGVAIPRIGQEVVVDFLEGDPDRPLITGRVYNAEQATPYDLPAHQTQTGIKSRSSKGGGTANFNEIRFEDKKGHEQIFIQGEKDVDVRVKNSRFETFGGENHLTVEKDQLELIKGDQHLHAKGDKNEKVDGTVSREAGANIQEKVGQNYALDAGTEIHLKAGMNLVIESGTTLTLKVGGNFVNINSGGVFNKGSMVMINSGGAAGSGAGSSPTAPKDPQGADRDRPG
jgi:type VI secretion system secreted protein VgrG